MKKYILMLACLSLTACMSGSGGNNITTPTDTHIKTAYELWLEAGNTGTYQDYLDSLVIPQTTPVSFTRTHYQSDVANNQNGFSNFTEIVEQWPNHDDYTRYTYRQTVIDDWNNIDRNWTVREKERTTGGYFLSHCTGTNCVGAQMNNVDFVNSGYYFKGENEGVYSYFGLGSGTPGLSGPHIVDNLTPTDGTTFTGDTMAFIAVNQGDAEFIKGDATLVYHRQGYNNPEPEVILNFDNYYTMTLQNRNGYDYATVTGTNATGNNNINIQTGEYKQAGLSGYEQRMMIGYAQRDVIEEAFGKYNFNSHGGYFNNDPLSIQGTEFKLNGAFGGTKQ